MLEFYFFKIYRSFFEICVHNIVKFWCIRKQKYVSSFISIDYGNAVSSRGVNFFYKCEQHTHVEYAQKSPSEVGNRIGGENAGSGSPRP